MAIVFESTEFQGHKKYVTLSKAKGLPRFARRFFTPYGRSHRPGVLRENDIMFSMLGTP